MDYLIAFLIVVLMFWGSSIANQHANMQLLRIVVDSIDRACVHLHNRNELDHKINSHAHNDRHRDVPVRGAN